MKVTVIHDEAGNISRLAASPAEDVSIGLGVQTGERMTEVNVPDASLGDKDLAERLADMIDNSRLETESGDSRLVQRG